MSASYYKARQGSAGIVVGITQESPIVFFSQSVVTCHALPCSRKHPSFSSKLNWAKIQTILSTFLGITQEAPMGDSWVIPTTIHALVVGSTHWAKTQTILSTVLGITQEAPMGGSWVIPSVTSLTECSVCTSISEWFSKKVIWIPCNPQTSQGHFWWWTLIHRSTQPTLSFTRVRVFHVE